MYCLWGVGLVFLQIFFLFLLLTIFIGHVLTNSPADLWGILTEPGNRVQTFFLTDSCSKDLVLQESN